MTKSIYAALPFFALMLAACATPKQSYYTHQNYVNYTQSQQDTVYYTTEQAGYVPYNVSPTRQGYAPMISQQPTQTSAQRPRRAAAPNYQPYVPPVQQGYQIYSGPTQNYSSTKEGYAVASPNYQQYARPGEFGSAPHDTRRRIVVRH